MELRQQEEESVPALRLTESSTVAPVEGPSIEQIVKQLSSRNKIVRAEAETQLAELGPAHADELLRVLETEGKKYRKHKCGRRKRFYAFGIFVLLYICLGLYLGFSSRNWNLFSNIGSFGGSFAGLGAAAALAPQHKSLLKVIAELEDKRSVGWLVDTLDTQDKEIKRTTEDALIKLLPRLTFQDSTVLDPERRRMLDRRLIKTDRPEFAAAILAAYETLGDSHSLESVETVELGRSHLKLSVLRETATAVAASIRERIPAELAAQSLLRATSSPSEPTETLLRPAQGSGNDDETLLLRPSTTEILQ